MESFAIAPAATRLSLVLPAIIAVAVILVVAVVAGTLYGSRTARFEVAPAGVTLKGDWYGREIPAAQVRVAEARRVDLSAEQAKQRWRDESRDRALFEREDQGEAGPGMLNRSFSGTY